MKKQQRAFVVETKSTRRRSKTASKSIWGDTDFRTLVREAETAHPFKSSVVSEVSGKDEALLANLGQLTESAVVTDHSDGKQGDPLATAADQRLQALQNEVLMNGDVAAVVAEKPRRRAPKRRKGHPASIVVKSSDVSAIVNEYTVSDELALLDAENQRLKWLLAERLRQQNTQLRKMFERFEIVR
jgi:hypothetical protein